MTDSRRIESVTAWGCFTLLLATYWLTVAPTVSYWDCPEYVSAAWLLEVGHPPGNPVWMLVERMVTMLAPSGRYAALAVNLSSGLFTAFAGFFLARTIFSVAMWILAARPRGRVRPVWLAAAAAVTGALAFGWCDSVWFSAVEAEVYAMSVFMTALCLWLMVRWAFIRSRTAAARMLVLIAYLLGLSIGIHQLNLLLIPALALVWAFRRGVRRIRSLIMVGLLSLGIVACVLMGMMPSTIALAAELELFFVNKLGLPFLSGVAAYVALLAVAIIVALAVTARARSRAAMAAAVFPVLFLSGVFVFSRHFVVGAAVSAIVAVLLVNTDDFQSRRLNLCVWMLAALLGGYSAYALIPVRGSVPSPANGSRPGEPFSFATYQSREQYGSRPLLYGRTPYSRPMLQEEFDSVSGRHAYSRYALLAGHPVMVPDMHGGRYRFVGNRNIPVYTPELDMWFPRLTGSSDYDLLCYSDWIGMDTASMVRVRVSEALDSLGRPVSREDACGRRRGAYSWRPTWLQHAQWLATYQIGYMYARYMMWNFSGRQNDIPSQGEVQHGNFITGFPAVDEAMLGPQNALPGYAGKHNPGRNVYWMLPLLLGAVGFAWMYRAGRRGKGACGIVAVLFIMTGVAIVVYLNQGPGEARERDYSFLGSWMAFAIWIGFGAVGLARLFRSAWALAVPLAVVAWMGFENFDDHDRSGRRAASNIAADVISSVEPDAIVFVDGDNGTFPLWYIQEVEGYRPDVRIVNLSYLSLPFYSEMMTRRWRDSAPLRLSVAGDSLLGGAYSAVRLGSGRDTLPAAEVLRRAAAGSTIDARYAVVPLPGGGSAVISLKSLSRNGFTLDRQRLMILDIVASNASRPVYWLRSIPSSARFESDSVTSMWLYGHRFGRLDSGRTDSLLRMGVRGVHAPNVMGKDVYMDKTPASQVASHRVSLLLAAERLLRDGHVGAALEAIGKADGLMGAHPLSYGAMRRHAVPSDTVADVRMELGRLMTEGADTLRARAASPALAPDAARRLRFLAIELRARGRSHISASEARKASWLRYRRALPPRLRPKMAPIQ